MPRDTEHDGEQPDEGVERKGAASVDDDCVDEVVRALEDAGFKIEIESSELRPGTVIGIFEEVR